MFLVCHRCGASPACSIQIRTDAPWGHELNRPTGEQSSWNDGPGDRRCAKRAKFMPCMPHDHMSFTDLVASLHTAFDDSITSDMREEEDASSSDSDYGAQDDDDC